MKALRHFLTALSCVVLGNTIQAAGFNTPSPGLLIQLRVRGELLSLTTLDW